CDASLAKLMIALARQQPLAKKTAHERRAISEGFPKLLTAADQDGLDQIGVIDQTYGSMEESQRDNIAIFAGAERQETQWIFAKLGQIAGQPLHLWGCLCACRHRDGNHWRRRRRLKSEFRRGPDSPGRRRC